MRTSRRTFLKSGALTVASYPLIRIAQAEVQSSNTITLFDGKSLEGWIQIQNSSTSFSGNDILDLSALGKKILGKADALSAFLNDQLDDDAKSVFAAVPNDDADIKTARSRLAKDFSKIVLGPSIYERERFKNIQMRPETQTLLKQEVRGRELACLNRMLLEDAYPSEFSQSIPTGWTVKNGAMASIGSGRGVIYTANDYSRYRLMFTMRHVSGNPDHQACVLLFCTRPQSDEVPLDALAGIQFQVPKGGHWDYRPGHNDSGGDEFTLVTKPQFDPAEWSRVEILADASAGTAKMAVAQPIGNKAVEVLDFKDPSAGKTGPIAWQTHNAGLFDEYKDVVIETNPRINELISVK